jgi:hypothetical protein
MSAYLVVCVPGSNTLWLSSRAWLSYHGWAWCLWYSDAMLKGLADADLRKGRRARLLQG